MRKARTGRLAAIVALSTALHAALIASVAFIAPQLAPATPTPMEPPAIMPVFLAPRTQPPKTAASRPTPPRPRTARHADVPAPVAPLVINRPAAPVADPSPAARETLDQAVRPSGLGCLNPSRLTPERRERCLEQAGARSRDAPFIPPGVAMSRQKRAELDAAAAQKTAARKALERPLSPGIAKYQPPDYDGEPYTTGVGARDPYGLPPPASRRAARKLDRLPP